MINHFLFYFSNSFYKIDVFLVRTKLLFLIKIKKKTIYKTIISKIIYLNHIISQNYKIDIRF